MNTEHRTLLDTAVVAHANAMVIRMGILDKFAEWKEDRSNTRPPLVSERAFLVGLILLTEEQSPFSIASLANLLYRRLTKESRELLDLPTTASSDPSVQSRRSYKSTWAAFQRMLSLMDPYPESASATSFLGIQVLLEDHDVVRETTMRARLNEFTQAFLQMTLAEQPRQLRRAEPRIDLTIDQIFIPSPMSTGLSRRSLDRHVSEERMSGRPSPSFRPTEVFAGWHHLVGTGAEESGRRGPVDFKWGWMANIALRVDSENPTEPQFPALVVAATLSMPGVEISEEAIQLMRASLSTGLRPGIVHADKAYFASQPIERLHLPTAKLGYIPSTDYRVDRLGVCEAKVGAEFIEGKAYCPDMPARLKHASIDFHNDQITAETYRRRLQERADYELHTTSNPDANGRYRMVCRVAASHHDAHESACSQQTVTFEHTDGMRTRQAFTYKSAKWEAFHRHAQSTSERFNAELQTLNTKSNGTPPRPRIRGFAAAQVLTTILLADYNRRITARFLRTGHSGQVCD